MIVQSPPVPSHPTSVLAREDEDRQVVRNWIDCGAVAAILAFFAYVSAVAPVPFPESVKLYLVMAFGPLISLTFVGFYHFFKLHRRTVALQAATIFGVVAGTIFTLMIVVQSAIHMTIPAGAREGLGLSYAGLNMVQLGMDVSWDIYFSIATILLGSVMFDHPRFGRIWGVVMLLVGVGLLALNLAAFPIPPEDAGSYDLGPVSGVLYLFVAFRVLTSTRWVQANLGD